MTYAELGNNENLHEDVVTSDKYRITQEPKVEPLERIGMWYTMPLLANAKVVKELIEEIAEEC